jgi:hypothetical protein
MSVKKEIMSVLDGDLFFIELTIDDNIYRMFVDTGATFSVIFTNEIYAEEGIVSINNIKVPCTDGSFINIKSSDFYIKNLPYVQKPCDEAGLVCNGIIGVNLLTKFDPIIISYRSKKIFFSV